MSIPTLVQIEDRLQKELFKLSDVALSQCVTALSAQVFFSERLAIPAEFLTRADMMNQRSISQIFHYIGQCGLVDDEVLAKMESVLTHRMHDFSFVSLTLIVTSLLYDDVATKDAARSIGQLVADHALKAGKGAIHPSDACYLLEAFLELDVCSEELLQRLTSNALDHCDLLRAQDVCQLVFNITSVSVLSAKDIYKRLLRTAPSITIDSLALQFKHVRLLCIGMKRLRFCLSKWLEPVEVYASRHFSELTYRKHGKDMIFLASVLAHLNYPAVSLFDRLAHLLEAPEDRPVFDVSIGLKVRLLWSLAVMKRFPTHGLKQLMGLTVEQVSS